MEIKEIFYRNLFIVLLRGTDATTGSDDTLPYIIGLLRRDDAKGSADII